MRVLAMVPVYELLFSHIIISSEPTQVVKLNCIVFIIIVSLLNVSNMRIVIRIFFFTVVVSKFCNLIHTLVKTHTKL